MTCHLLNILKSPRCWKFPFPGFVYTFLKSKTVSLPFKMKPLIHNSVSHKTWGSFTYGTKTQWKSCSQSRKKKRIFRLPSSDVQMEASVILVSWSSRRGGATAEENQHCSARPQENNISITEGAILSRTFCSTKAVSSLGFSLCLTP